MKTKTLSPELLHQMDAFWRAANYLSVGQIYLYDNPLLKRPLTLADVNCLLSVMDHCLRSRHYVNVVIAGKHPAPQWLTMDAAVKHCTQGIGIWQWASNDQAVAPDVVMACCGDVPTLETLAAVSILREHLPDLKIRVVNVVDIMKQQLKDKLIEHKQYIDKHGQDMPEIRNWKWKG